MEPTAEQRAPEVTAARTEPALLAARAVAAPQEDMSGAGAPRSDESEVRTYGEFKLPEGVTVDAEQLKPVTELFAASGLDQEQAQKFIDLALARETAAQQRGTQAFVDLQNQWVSEIKADPDIGGDKLELSLATAGRAIDRLDVPGLREALGFTGAGNHPAVVKAFVRLGRLLSEDRFRPGQAAAPRVPRSPAEVIYDGHPRT
jgi:hypothetical protein